MLGGFFGSRLMKNIREEKGLTYGISSSINPLQKESIFLIGADVGKDKLESAQSEISKEIKTLADIAVPKDELEIAKNHFLGSLQLEVANPFSSLEKLKNISLNNLHDQYYNNLFQSIKKEEPEHLRQIGEKYFLAPLFEVIVG
ncbi:MAG: insulinase family protein [Cyclobacteriaceae bacterium]